MLLTCLALGLISCKDTVDPREARSPSPVQKQEATGPVTVLRLTCTLSFSGDRKGEVSCGEPGAGASGVNRSVVLPVVSEYARWLPYYLVKDTVAETWSFLSIVENLLAQPIGTVDGTTAVGTKVAVTYGPVASAGTGAVSLINADGTGNFTAPDQPYFDYPGIVAPGAYSTYRTWQVHVPNTVTEVTMGAAISTDFPAELNVAASPPDSEPGWFAHDTSWVNHGDAPGGFLKHVIAVLFQGSTSVADKQLAVALINGTVIGGATFVSGEGYYFLLIEDDGTGTQLRAAIAKLQALPQVYGAALLPRVRPAYLKPYDGDGWTQWSIDPDHLSSSPGKTWALEAINAPMAWGCSVGSATTKIGIVDEYFDSTDVTPNVIHGSGLFGADPDSARHGGPASAILAARGNDSTGITGVMWHAGLMLDQPGHNAGTVLPVRLAQAVERLSYAGASVINLSWEQSYARVLSPTAVDSASADTTYMFWLYPRLRDLQVAGKLPLLVVAAGNSNVDAYLNPFTHISSDFPAIAVGGSTRDQHRYHIPPGMPAEADRRGSNFGLFMDLYAPGMNVPTEAVVSGSIVPVSITGTSFAAPFITGIAGLLKSLDPSLTAAELRTLILGGANEGGRQVTDTKTGRPVYLANAYESLKLAAQRPTASICANRMWAADSQIFVQRDSSSSTGQSIYHADGPIVGMFPLHLGVINFGVNQTDRHLSYQNGVWVDGAGWDTVTAWGGPGLSSMGKSHDADTSAYSYSSACLIARWCTPSTLPRRPRLRCSPSRIA